MKRAFALTLVAAGLALAASSVVSAGQRVGVAAGVNCKTSATIGYMGPTTGPVASIGQELRNWSVFPFRQWNAKHKNGRQYKIIEGDTQFNPAEVSTIATQFASNKDMIAVVGPGASQEVQAAAPIFTKVKMPFIAASATRTTLTDGHIPTFFRISPPDSLQALSTADFMANDLHSKNVFIVDDQSAYSVPLGDEVEKLLKAKGVAVTRSSVTQQQSDYSSTVTSIPSGTDLVYLPIQIPAKMQLIAQQMKEQGKNITIFAGDAGYSNDFTIVGSYFSAFAPDVRTFPQAKATVAAYFKMFGAKAPLTTFGPPSYVAGQVIIAAVEKACKDGTATRAEVLKYVHQTNLPTTILNHAVTFTAHGDDKLARFVTFKITAKGPITIK
jgi:branched-chain amino acid transport system substrate-binding protein